MNQTSEERIWVLFALILYGMILFRWPWFQLVPDERGPGTRVRNGLLHVRVIGEVRHPGLYDFREPGGTVRQAIEASGGPTPNADLERLNLLAPLLPDTVLRVPSIRSGFKPVISLNRSMTQELMMIPGVGPKLAERIIRYRTEKGRFDAPEDLLHVPGVGPHKLRQILRHAVLK